MATGRGCARGLGCVVVLVLLAVGVWLARDSIGGWTNGLKLGATGEPSEQLARDAEAKLDKLAREGLAEPVRLSEAELQSLLTYRSGPALPAGIEDPRVDVQDTIVVLSARLRPDRLEGFRTPDAVASVLEDTSRVTTGLLPVVERPGEALLRLRNLQIGAFVMPPLMYPALMRSLQSQGVRTSDGALVVSVPRSIGEIRIEGDDLVLLPAVDPSD